MNKKRKRKLIESSILFAIILLIVFFFSSGEKKVQSPAPQTKELEIKTEVYEEPKQQVEEEIKPANQTTVTPETMPIFMYHHVRDYDNPEDKIGTNLSVSPKNLESQLDLIQQKGYNTTTFDELTVAKPVILTFDDAYDNFYSNVFPLLKEKNMKAVVFVIYNDIGKIGYMTLDQLKEISDYGIEIGSHTLSHLDLAKSTSSKASGEISSSKANLERDLNIKINSFCYPAGKYNDEVVNMVKEAGYLYATTTNGGISNFSNPYALNRYRMNKDTSISSYIK